jgi:hypothetical protein
MMFFGYALDSPFTLMPKTKASSRYHAPPAASVTGGSSRGGLRPLALSP